MPDDSIPAGQVIAGRELASLAADNVVDHSECERRFTVWSEDFEGRLANHFDAFAESQNNRLSSLEAAIASINNAVLSLTAPPSVAADCSHGTKRTTGPLAGDPHWLKAPGGNRYRRWQRGRLLTPSPLPQVLNAR